ncbi:MAG: T9SS type A sorting domain-containing protein [Bacteroidota bacterium]|nr:T9SS type A sorting domain-containing protein [Bacteroidota bacterium]
MKSIFLLLTIFLPAISVHSQTLAYADTIVTPLGEFMWETNEEPISEMTFNQQTQIAEDGGYSEHLNFYPFGARFAATISSESVAFSISPNPTQDRASLFIKNGGTTLTVSIRDISGRVISVETFNSVDGTYLRNLELSGYSQGLYFIDITTNGSCFTHKLVKQ